jgi:hypothetical protein
MPNENYEVTASGRILGTHTRHDAAIVSCAGGGPGRLAALSPDVCRSEMDQAVRGIQRLTLVAEIPAQYGNVFSAHRVKAQNQYHLTGLAPGLRPLRRCGPDTPQCALVRGLSNKCRHPAAVEAGSSPGPDGVLCDHDLAGRPRTRPAVSAEIGFGDSS